MACTHLHLDMEGILQDLISLGYVLIYEFCFKQICFVKPMQVGLEKWHIFVLVRESLFLSN